MRTFLCKIPACRAVMPGLDHFESLPEAENSREEGALVLYFFQQPGVRDRLSSNAGERLEPVLEKLGI